MVCDNCKINAATISWQQSSNDEIFKINLCSSCADKLSLDIYFSNFFKDFLDEIEKIDFFSKKNESLDIKRCKICGNTLEMLKKTGKVGCSNCYAIFKEELKPILNKIQSSHKHIGKLPQKLGPKVKIKMEIQELKKELELAVAEEKFELAAKIRDNIREMERGI